MGRICTDRQRAERDFLLMTERLTSSSVPVRASGEPQKWEIADADALVQVANGLNIPLHAEVLYRVPKQIRPSPSPSDDGAPQPQDVTFATTTVNGPAVAAPG